MSLSTDLFGDGVIHSLADGGVVAPVAVSAISAVTIAGVGLGVTQGQWHQRNQSKELSGENVRLGTSVMAAIIN